MSAPDEELRRLVEEAARAARDAQAAAERVEREQPSRFEQILNAVSNLLRTLVDGLLGRLRAEVEGARRAGEEFVARVLLAVSRSAGHLARALAWSLAAALFATIGFVVLTVALVAFLNARWGDPNGTFAVAALFVAAALAAALVAQSKVRAVGREAEALAPARRR